MFVWAVVEMLQGCFREENKVVLVDLSFNSGMLLSSGQL